MIEIVLSALLAIASGVGVLFWRKSVDARSEARRTVSSLRQKADEESELRKETIAANVESIESKIDEAGDDRQALADMLNRG